MFVSPQVIVDNRSYFCKKLTLRVYGVDLDDATNKLYDAAIMPNFDGIKVKIPSIPANQCQRKDVDVAYKIQKKKESNNFCNTNQVQHAVLVLCMEENSFSLDTNDHIVFPWNQVLQQVLQQQ